MSTPFQTVICQVAALIWKSSMNLVSWQKLLETKFMLLPFTKVRHQAANNSKNLSIIPFCLNIYAQSLSKCSHLFINYKCSLSEALQKQREKDSPPSGCPQNIGLSSIAASAELYYNLSVSSHQILGSLRKLSKCSICCLMNEWDEWINSE